MVLVSICLLIINQGTGVAYIWVIARENWRFISESRFCVGFSRIVAFSGILWQKNNRGGIYVVF